jgi:dTMP kinase
VPAEEVGRVEAGKEVNEKEAGTEPEIADKETESEDIGRERDPKTGQFVKKAEESADKAVSDDLRQRTETETGRESVQADGSANASKYEKAKKEKERQKSLLAGFDEEKARFRAQAAAEKAEIEREKQRIEEEKLKIRAQRNGQRPVDENGEPIYSSYELRDLAKDYRRRALKGEEGPNGENYAEVSERAEVAADRAAAREAKEAQELFERRQSQLAMEAMTAHPELSDENAPLTQEIKAVFAQEAELSKKYDRPSIFRMIPDGFAMALEVAKLRQKAFGAEAKDQKIAELEKEIDRLNKLTTLGSSSPIQARQPKPREQMTADELLDEMDNEARKQGAKIWAR